MPSLGGNVPSRHLKHWLHGVRGGRVRYSCSEVLSRAGGTLASALPSEGIYALAHNQRPRNYALTPYPLTLPSHPLLSPDPPRLDGLPGAAYRKRPFRDIFGNRRPGGGIRAVADSHRRN